MTTQGGGAAPGTRSRFGWLRQASDRVPTRWFAGIGTGLFLAATAAFGGLATAEGPAIASLEPGEAHRNDQLSITVERAVLVDELPEAGVYVEDDEDVLAVQVEVTNRWTQALEAGPTSTVIETVGIAELDGVAAASVARYDDATVTPWLQPGVPVELVITWAVGEGEYADGDELHLTLADYSLYTASFVTTGQSWEDPVAAATMTLRVDESGAGG